MGLFDELKQAIDNEGSFEKFIIQKTQEDRRFLGRTFWVDDGEQTSVLNYLILAHDQQYLDLRSHIQFVLRQGADVYSNQSLHLAFQQKKIDLIPLLLSMEGSSNEANAYPMNSVTQQGELNSRDSEGQTLLSRAIEAQNIDYLRELLRRGANPDQASERLQPIHQAVLLNFREGVEVLIQFHAQKDNPCGDKKETPLLLAAHCGKIDALEALLAYAQGEDLNIENNDALSAMDLLCQRLKANKSPKDTIRGIAMLICRGASLPRSESFRYLLRNYRDLLLEEVTKYTQNEPQLTVKFVRAGHDKNNPLHAILFSENYLTRSIKHFFGRADTLVFKFEALVGSTRNEPYFAAEAQREPQANYERDEILFAEFVNRYDKSIKSVIFFNPWSDMRWKITRGDITCWKDVLDYTREHPKSRSAKIWREMSLPTMAVHEVLDRELESSEEGTLGLTKS